MSERKDPKERQYLMTHSATDGEYSRHLNYLLENGSRWRVTIGSAFDTPELREKLGAALHKRHGRGRK